MERSGLVRRVVRLTLCVALLASMVVWAQSASAESDFRRVFNTQVNGSIVTVGNTVLGCGDSATCVQVRDRGGANNSAPQVYADSDTDPSTFNSSAALLSLPAGAKVLHARLYWMADGPTGATSTEVQLKAPGAAAYRTVPATFRDASVNRYVGAADITDIVTAGGSGDYWVANILARTGTDTYAGWAINLAYESADEPLRDLTMFEGFKAVRGGQTVSSTISGFLTPPTGTVQAKIGAISGEGDRSTTGDALRVNGRPLSDAVTPDNDFFNSRISALGADNTERTPYNSNTLGFDAKQVAAPGYLPNSATAAQVEFTSTGDVYFPVALTTQVDIFAPKLAGQKSVQNLSGGAQPKVGDVLEYTVTMDNVGEDAAIGARLSDSLPAGVTYVPGSLRITRGAGEGALTDVAGDDRGRYTQETRRLDVSVGTGGGPDGGGRLAAGAGFTVTFRVTVDRESAGKTVTNTARLDYTAETINKPYATERSVAFTAVELADVGIVKTIDRTSLTAGGAARYELVVTNHGPNTAQGVRVRDEVPAGMQITGVTASAGSCATVDRAVDCQIGTLANGASVTVGVAVRVAVDQPAGALSNSASVSSTTADDRQTNNAASVTATVARSADLAVRKTASPAAPAPGEALTYTITVRNNGPSSAERATVTDKLPVQLLSPSVATQAGTCDPPGSGGTVQCALPTLQPGQDVTITVRGIVDPDYRGASIDNTATATAVTPDPNSGDNSATARTTLAPARADVVLTKVASPVPAVPGTPVTYTVTARNNGPSSARDVVISDVLPAQLSGATANTSQGACAIDGAGVRCAAGTVSPGATVTVTISGRVLSNVTSPIVNTATATSSTSDPTPPTATTTTQVRPTANLRIGKTARPQPVNAGDEVTYTLAVHNAGPSDATEVMVTDPVPAPLRFVRAESSTGTCAFADGAVRCQLGTVPDGGDATVTVTASVPDNADPVGIDNTATVSTTAADPDLGDNTATYTVRTAQSANVRISKTADRATLAAGEQVTYTLTVVGDGPSAARNVVVTDTLPAGMTVRSTQTTAGQCTADGATITCALGVLPRDGVATVTVVAAVDPDQPAGTLTNTATVVTATPETTDSDNESSTVTEVRRAADLTAGKNADPATVDAGREVTFTLTAHNAGPSTAQETVLTDVIPDGMEFVSGQGPGGPCTVLDSQVSCPVGAVAVGADATAAVTVRVLPGATAGTVTNTAQVSSGTPDLNPGGNTATATVTVRTSAKVSVVKTADPADLIAGGPVTYTVTVTNDGPSTARAVAVVDDVPTEVGGLTATAAQGTCAVREQHAGCDLGDLDPGTSTTVQISGTVVPGATGEIRNSATATSDTPNPDPSGTTGTTTGTVTAQADLTLDKVSDPPVVRAGNGMVYTLRAVNQGPSISRDVLLTDTLPAGVTSTGVETENGQCEVDGQVVTCRSTELAVGAALVVRIKATVDEGVVAGELTNSATAGSATPDPTPEGNTATAITQIEVAADLAVTKSSNATVVVPGKPLGYDVKVSNDGPSTATGVSVTDTLPAGMTATDVTVTPAEAGRCDIASGRIDCAFDTIRQGQSVVVTINDAVLDPEFAEDTVVNGVSVSATSPDPNQDNNSVDYPLPVHAFADLAVTKSADPATVVPGRPLTYTVTVTNLGPSVARTATVTDAVNERLRITSATLGNGEACAITGNTVDCAVGDLPVGASATVTIRTDVPADFPGGRFSNTAVAGSATADADSGNNSATVAVGSEPSAGVSVTKTADPATVVPGRPVTFTITVTNHGPSTAREITVVDQVDGRLREVAATAAGQSCAVTDNEVTCELGDLADGATVPVTVTAMVPADFGDQGFANQALVTGPTPDPEPGDNVTVVEVGSAPEADLAVVKTADSSTVVAARDLTYTLAVTNRGPSDASDVRLVDTPPDQTQLKSVQAPEGVTCSEDQVIDCALGTVAAGQTVQVTVVVTVDPAARGPIRNSASVVSPVDDPDTTNNTGVVEVTATGESDLSAVKTASAERVVVGDTLTYTVVVRNDGPSAAAAVEVADTLPGGVTLVSESATTGDYDPVAGKWAVGALAAGQSETLTVTVQVDIAGDMVNTAVVSSPGQDDPDPANNESRTSTEVSEKPAPPTTTSVVPPTTSSEPPVTTSSSEPPVTTSSSEPPVTTTSSEPPPTTTSSEPPPTTTSSEPPPTTTSSEPPATTSVVPPTTTSPVRPTSTSPVPAGDDDDSDLAATGAPVGMLLRLGMVLLAAGIVVRVAATRRRVTGDRDSQDGPSVG